MMEASSTVVPVGSGSGDKLSTWLETWGDPSMAQSLSGGNIGTMKPPTTEPSAGGSEEGGGTGDFTRMLLGSLSLGSSDDFTLPPRPFQFQGQGGANPYELPPVFAVPPPVQQGQSLQTLPTSQFTSPQNPLSHQLQQQLEQLRVAQQQHQELQYRLGLMYPQSPLPPTPTLSQPLQQPQEPQMNFLTPLQPVALPPLSSYLSPSIHNLGPTPMPTTTTQTSTQPPQFSRIPFSSQLPPQTLYPFSLPQHQSLHSQQVYGECTFARFTPKVPEEPEAIPPSTNLGGSVGDKGGASKETVAPLVVLYQPFYQPDYSDGDGDAADEDSKHKRKVKGEKETTSETRGESDEERPTFPFILKLATKRKEEEHMRFGFALDADVRGRPIQLTIKEEILQRPPRKEKTSKKGGKSDKDGGAGRGRGRSAGKKTKVKESEKEDPEILFRGRLEPNTSGSADMRASSVHGLMTPLHWVLDRNELTINFKAAEGSGMNIIRYQFHIQDAERLHAQSPASENSTNNPYYVSDPTTSMRPVRWVAMSVPAIICSHSTSQFQRALLALIHYHFHKQDLVASEDLLACFELLAGGDFRQFQEAFSSFPLPAGSSVVRGTDVPAILEWFLASWKIFSVDNYMALYKLGYVHGFLGRDEAQESLRNQEEGTFLIRLGSNGLSMSIRYSGQIMPVEIDPNTLKQISITVAADPAVKLLCRDGTLVPKELLIQAITAIPRFGYASVARLASLAKERQEHQSEPRNNEEGENKRKRN